MDSMIGPITDLPHLLAQISGHICPDAEMPWLHGIYFEAEGGYLYAVATDRYTLAVTRRELEVPALWSWSVFVPVPALKSVRAFVRLNRRVGILLDADDSLNAPSLTLAANGQQLTVPALAGRHPQPWRSDWRRYLRDNLAAEPDLHQEVHLSPLLLARWGTARGTDRSIPLTAWSAGPLRPLVVSAGPDFLGLQMPVHLRDDNAADFSRASIRDAWADALSTTAAVTAA